MKTLIEKLPVAEDNSFVTKTFRTPQFEVPWHQHIEYELILITEGEGLSFVGNFAGEYKTGDVFFIGKNVPHTFQKKGDGISSAVVIQFQEDFWGKEFLDLPETKEVKALFATAGQGLQLRGQSKLLLGKMIRELEHFSGFKRIIRLCECLELIAREKDFIPLSTEGVKLSNPKNKERIEGVFRFTMESFRQSISLSDVAEIAGMSVPAFCNFFKKSTKKTYIDFLNEVRIAHACKLLIETDSNILNICYDSGFNTLANFNKQFLKVKKLTPSRYRKGFSGRNN
ncbi:AraC family transcriptional regulator [Nafulsella turpanensis]|uniref:AraC family transcriptional regulator n=1 Tax=Nafulsella turpanensis TaxID=1265690 RepID=UPI00034B22BE|nr:AraC family transcriptional regulator [Nafulsella turpanensis]